MPVPDYFPGGTMKPASDAAHAAGMDFMLWFEPERIAMNYVQRVCPVSPSVPVFFFSKGIPVESVRNCYKRSRALIDRNPRTMLKFS